MSEVLHKALNKASLENIIKKIKQNKLTFSIIMSVIVISIFSLCFMASNEGFYSKTIAKVTSLTEKESSKVDGVSGKVEKMKQQQVTAIIMNGSHKGSKITMQNTTSFSQVYDLDLKVNDEIFVTLQESGNKITSSKILDIRRDKYIGYITILFVMLITIIGSIKGLKSIASVVVNMLIFFVMLEVFLHVGNIILLASIASIFFILGSIIIACGINKKTISTIVGTFAGTVVSILIAALVIKLTHSNGIHYEEMDFIRPPEQVFFAEIIIGTLGGIMDIAISISSAINELYEQNPFIERKALISSAREIGKDIMGTMANTLVFAYVSGSIPIILLLLRNGFPISYVVNINLSLEFIRALTGSIGIVISIPITIYTSIKIISKNKIGEL